MEIVDQRFRDLQQYSGKILGHFYKHKEYVDKDYEGETRQVID
jgi:hypothetical protein